ncbi:tubulin epsilon chain-like [Coccinella septempunctata]|uniref:tubulin epsilon chain-like n=1 Tax=Coccinella septempunctata TaxID=41139 RepID=UPI001D07D1E1|nr:tubulin epsilon chain-like [Coccinella septempunctata]
MSEFLIIQVGQCGNQIGGSLWPSILQEYKILPCQHPNTVGRHGTSEYVREQRFTLNSFLHIPNLEHSGGFQTLNLSELKKNNVKARVICIDMEDSVLSRFSNSKLSFLFDKSAIIRNYPGSSNNWAEGYCTHGSTFKNNILKIVTKYVERCDSLHGILLVYSMGGGTGSGLGSFVLEQLDDHFPNIERFVVCVYPNGSEDVVTGPYNAMLATQYLARHATCVFPAENRALQDLCDRRRLTTRSEDARGCWSVAGTFDDLNSILVKLLLHVTSGSRFSGQLNFDMNEINTNMVPFPQMKFLCSSFSPIGIYEGNSVSSTTIREKNFWNACSKTNQLLKIDPLDVDSSLMASMLFGRGEYTLTDMRNYVNKLQRKAPYLEWSKKCTKVGLCSIPPIDSKFSMMALFNTSSTKEIFFHISEQFHKLMRRKAHVHHYTKVPGFEFDCFYECQNTIADIIDIYEEAGTSNGITEERISPNINY